MGSDASSIALTREYLDIIFYGTFIVMIQISLNGALNAQGDTKSYRNVLIFSFFLKYFFKSIIYLGIWIYSSFWYWWTSYCNSNFSINRNILFSL
jgi:Na+-driven multidrug efflux pump